MPTLNEMIYEIKMLLRNNRISDDDRLDNRVVERWIVNQRALWIGNKLSSSPKPPHALIQDLGCVNITTADPAECCDFNTNCTVLRTASEIPSTIEAPSFDGITRVGPVDKFQNDYMYVSYERSHWAGGGYFNGDAVIATRLNNYMYIMSRSPKDYFKYLEFINVQGIFENPRDVSSFVRCSGGSCFSPDEDYPITERLWAYMKGQIVEGNFGILTSVLSDKTNDADARETDRA